LITRLSATLTRRVLEGTEGGTAGVEGVVTRAADGIVGAVRGV
jgi:hypothetical protein